MARTPNTVEAHRLIWLAGQHGCQDAVVEALFLAYFTHGRDLSNRTSLVDVVVQAGLPKKLADKWGQVSFSWLSERPTNACAVNFCRRSSGDHKAIESSLELMRFPWVTVDK